MATEFKLPRLGETAESGTVVKLMVTVGDQLTIDQPVLELESGKAVLEVPSEVSGTIREIFAKEGATLNLGDVILSVDEQAAPASANGAAPPAATSQPDKQEAAPVQEATPVAVPETKPAPAAAATVAAAPPAAKAPVVTQLSEINREPAPAAPSVRRLAREIGVDIHQVAGTGIGGRITEDDVKRHAKQIIASKSSGAATAGPLPDFAKWGAVERKPLSKIRAVTAERMAASWATVAHVTQFDKADVTALEELRKAHAKQAEAAGGKLTVTAIALKVVAAALKKFPQFNSSLDLAAGELVLKSYIHIGVAVDTEHGLLVPVIRDVDKKNIIELATELGQIAVRARERKIGMDELQGGCFTITNLGGIGGTQFTPIVNYPEVAILGLSRGSIEARYEGGAFQPRLMLPLSLSYDHRVIDGADGARFLRWVAGALEQPFLLSLEG